MNIEFREIPKNKTINATETLRWIFALELISFILSKAQILPAEKYIIKTEWRNKYALGCQATPVAKEMPKGTSSKKIGSE